MSLTLYFHPLASFCQKVLMALYESGTPLEPHIVDLADDTSRAEFRRIWPLGKFPVLRDKARDQTIPESTIIIEYLALHHAGATQLLPDDPELAWQTRLRDRFYDLSVNVPMQKVVTDKLRPAGRNDPHGVHEAREALLTAYGVIDKKMETRIWAMGDAFTMADCAAAPALFYANKAVPIGEAHGNAARYLERLMERPSFARVIKEAQPYLTLFPLQPGAQLGSDRLTEPGPSERNP